MVAVGVCKFGEAGAIEVNPVRLREVRILLGIHATSFEPDLTFRLVDEMNVPDQPIAFGDLVLQLAGYAVIEVEVLPAIALRSPDDFFAVINVVTVFAASGKTGPEKVVIEESLRDFRDERAGGGSVGIHLDHGVGLMPPLVVFEGESAAVIPPNRRAERIRIREQRPVNLRLLAAGQ